MPDRYMDEWYMVVARYQAKTGMGPFGDALGRIFTYDSAVVLCHNEPRAIAEVIEPGFGHHRAEVLLVTDDYTEALDLANIFDQTCYNSIAGHFERDAWAKFYETRTVDA